MVNGAGMKQLWEQIAMKTLLLTCAAMGMAISTGASAAVVFDFSLTPGDQGQTHTYTVSGLSITASAFGPASNTGAPDHLWGKNGGGDENGLGMTNDLSGQNEIYFGQGFVQLDLNALVGLVIPNSILFGTNSTTNGEQWTVWGSNTAGVLGSATLPAIRTQVAQGTNEATNLALTGGFRYYDFVSTSQSDGQNFLITSLTVTPVPEPAGWALMILGFGGIGAAIRRRRSMASAVTV
jgi:hypothetical protein